MNGTLPFQCAAVFTGRRIIIGKNPFGQRALKMHRITFVGHFDIRHGEIAVEIQPGCRLNGLFRAVCTGKLSRFAADAHRCMQGAERFRRIFRKEFPVCHTASPWV